MKQAIYKTSRFCVFLLSGLLLTISNYNTEAFSFVNGFNSQLKPTSVRIHGSFFDDIFGSNKKGSENNSENEKQPRAVSTQESDGTNDDLDIKSWKEEISRRENKNREMESNRSEITASSATFGETESDEDDEIEEFDGYALRDVILSKFGQCFDLDFRVVRNFGEPSVYLNVMPFRLGSRRFRHETELDYLCHLQAIVEILVKYDQLDNVMVQIMETDKMPRAGTSPLIAVPLRLDLTKNQLRGILGEMF